MNNLISELDKLQLNNKKSLGQFYTTNYNYILKNLYIPDTIEKIIEPFAGNGDLSEFINNSNAEYYDIDPKKDFIKQRDTLLEPIDYNNKFIITNPPYLARNKSKDKTIFDKYNQNDLYKCFLSDLLINQCIGGILILPLNFFCSIRSNDILLRKNFLKTYYIKQLNIFEEQVFNDTKYCVCSFQFELLNNNLNSDIINCTIYPLEFNLQLKLNENNNYIIGGELYKLSQNKNIKIERLTKNNIDNINKTNILIKCIDNNINNQISASIVSNNNRYVDNTTNLSARSFISLIIYPKISLEIQEKIVFKFNIFLDINRKKYNSLFLTNYRESNIIARKRISFKLIFIIVNHLLSDEIDIEN